MKDERLTLAAADLCRAAPSTWKVFLEAFGQYADARKTECVQAPLEELPRSQGRAQLANMLHTLFSTAVKDADSIVEKKNKAHHSPQPLRRS